MMNFNMNKKQSSRSKKIFSRIRPYAGMWFIFLMLVILIGMAYRYFVLQGKRTVEEYAVRIKKICAVSPMRAELCYENEIENLVHDVPMEMGFAVIKNIQAEKNSKLWNCHNLGHQIARQEIRKKQEEWKDIFARCPVGECREGCQHGVLQEHFKSSVLNDEQLTSIIGVLQKACIKRKDWNPIGADIYNCLHAQGHLTVYLTAADLPKSLDICRRITGGNDTDQNFLTCVSGMFMQVYLPYDVDGEALVKDMVPKNRDTLLKFCSPYSGSVWTACMVEAWPIFAADVQSSDGIMQFCTLFKTGKDQVDCVKRVVAELTLVLNVDIPRIEKICMELPREWTGECFGALASQVTVVDIQLIPRALTVCPHAPDYAKEGCYKREIENAKFDLGTGSPAYKEICRGIQEPWKALCISK